MYKQQTAMWRNYMYYNNFHKQITIVLSGIYLFLPCVLFFCVLFRILMLLIFPACIYLLDIKNARSQSIASYDDWVCLDTLIGELKQWTKQWEVICNEQALFPAVTVQTVSMHWWIQFDWHIAVTGWSIFLLLAYWNVGVNSSGVNCSLL